MQVLKMLICVHGVAAKYVVTF